MLPAGLLALAHVQTRHANNQTSPLCGIHTYRHNGNGAAATVNDRSYWYVYQGTAADPKPLVPLGQWKSPPPLATSWMRSSGTPLGAEASLLASSRDGTVLVVHCAEVVATFP